MDLTDILLIAVGGTLWLWLLIWLVRNRPLSADTATPPRSRAPR